MKRMRIMLLTLCVVAIAASPFAGKSNASLEKNKFIEQKNEKIRKKVAPATILEVSDSICEALNVPAELVREIGQNESGWRCIKSKSGGTDYGDLQVIEKTFNYWYNELNLTGGKTRRNYLIVGINYLKYQHNRYNSWEKARFAYARGNYRSKTTWTCLEEKFMKKIKWSKYDKK
ncbi:MAG: hypothetical protein ACI8ZN_001774 [Bacteroidia bacterium]|jgi:hypothetical protein